MKIGAKMAISETVNLSKDSVDFGTGYDADSRMCLVGDQLRRNNTCKSLTLNDQRIREQGATGLFAGLKENRTLKELYLSRCCMHSSAEAGKTWGDGSPMQYSTSGMPQLVDALMANRTLTTLNIDGNVMSAECATHLAEMLKVNTTLETLSITLSFLDADSDGCLRALAEALTDNLTLKRLDVSQNRTEFVGLHAEGLAHLAEALKVNQSLTKLDLAASLIDDEGALLFVEALKVNRTLEDLNLSNNSIKNRETIKALKDAAALDRPKAVDVSLFGAFALSSSKAPGPSLR